MAKKKDLSRRSFLSTVSGAAVALGAMGTITTSARAQNYSGNTDSDTGYGSDSVGYGRSGLTDNDSGSNADRAGYGRGGITDNDSGSNSDPVGRGRGARSSGLTDNDTGSYSDPVGNGRGRRATGYTDGDVGNMRDPVGNGRGNGGYQTGITDGDSASGGSQRTDRAGYGRGTDH